MSQQVFISHKNVDTSNYAADALRLALEKQGFSVFLDRNVLEPGMAWSDTIKEQLQQSDVLVVLIEAETANSNWVQREVDMARGANIRILPIIVGSADASATIDRLDLSSIQYMHYDVRNEDALVAYIKKLSEQTTIAQQQWITRRQARHERDLNPETRTKVAVYERRASRNLAFHIAQGDATRIKGYDVLVNTENTFMQMARAYERNTLSGKLREKASRKENGYLLEDYMQNQLFAQVYRTRPHHLPVIRGRVIVTEPGHPQSEMVRKGTFRYVFHAAAVDVRRSDFRVDAPTPGDISEIIQNCFNTIATVDRNHGAILHDPDGQLEAADPNYDPIESILFPVFGTGHGRGKFDEAIGAIVNAFSDHTHDLGHLHLNKIGLCVYAPRKIPNVAAIFEAQGFEKVDQ